VVAYHAAAVAEPDPARRHRQLHDGLYAATAALDPEGSQQIAQMCSALAHRSVLLAEIGHHDSALADARRARAIALDLGLRREQVIAAVGEVVARWHLSLDTSVLLLVEEAKALAVDLDVDDFLRPLLAVEIDVLWSLGRHDKARALMQADADRLHMRLLRQTGDRWEQVRAGVDRLRQASAGEADVLTGLPNGQFLGRWLPEALADDSPTCIAAMNIDGFEHINEAFGYEVGDGVIQEVATVLERVCRRGDSVARVAGDEFVMVLCETSPGDARVVFERVRQLIAARAWSALPTDVHVTLSVGATVGSGSINSTRLLATANDALRRAKSTGGDLLVFG
jgi:diguanylate cyclase (GGDEF)-like protein